MNKTRIEWCTCSWNPVTGCLHNCNYCYAKRIAHRFGDNTQGMNKTIIELNEKANTLYPYGFQPTLHRYRLDEPRQMKRQQNIFVCSMADLFGDWVPGEWTDLIFTTCFDAPQHNYLFLTKSPERYDYAIMNYAGEERGIQESYELFNNMWFGATVTNQDDMKRIESLDKFDEGHRFLSIEPLHGPITLDLKKSRCPACNSFEVYTPNPLTSQGLKPTYCDSCGWEGETEELKEPIEWVIIGAESGNRKNKILPEAYWIAGLVIECEKYGIPVFMKDSLIPIVGEENMKREFPEGLKI